MNKLSKFLTSVANNQPLIIGSFFIFSAIAFNDRPHIEVLIKLAAGVVLVTLNPILNRVTSIEEMMEQNRRMEQEASHRQAMQNLEEAKQSLDQIKYAIENPQNTTV